MFSLSFSLVGQAHTAIKNSGASQREMEARITQAHQELAAEQEGVRRAREDRAAAEARWAEEVRPAVALDTRLHRGAEFGGCSSLFVAPSLQRKPTCAAAFFFLFLGCFTTDSSALMNCRCLASNPLGSAQCPLAPAVQRLTFFAC